jgi:hypothetical protein
MRVAQYEEVYFGRDKGEGLVVRGFNAAAPLEQSAVEQYPKRPVFPVGRNKVA